jgi:hypothetical protein
MDSHPIQAGAFQRFMKAQFSNLPTWLSVVSFGTEFAAASKPETPLFVDVGGGIGQQCVLLREKLPDVMGKIVLQDRPDVLKNAIVKDGVDVMPYDYLTEQPVKGMPLFMRRARLRCSTVSVSSHLYFSRDINQLQERAPITSGKSSTTTMTRRAIAS